MKRRLIVGGSLLLALVIGIAIGSSGKSKATAGSTITQTTTLTVTNKAATQTKTVVKPDCTNAITAARSAYTTVGNAFGLFSQLSKVAVKAITAAANHDSTTLSTLVPQINTINASLNSDESKTQAELASFAASARRCK